MTDDLEKLWSDLLSGDAMRVRAAWQTLTTSERRAVRTHLRRMASEDGWTELQRGAAQAALAALLRRASRAPRKPAGP